MNEQEAKRLVRKALDADRIIHTQQLGLPWEEPRYWFLNNVGPLRRYKAKRTATKLAAEVLAGGTQPRRPCGTGRPSPSSVRAPLSLRSVSPVFAIARWGLTDSVSPARVWNASSSELARAEAAWGASVSQFQVSYPRASSHPGLFGVLSRSQGTAVISLVDFYSVQCWFGEHNRSI